MAQMQQQQQLTPEQMAAMQAAQNRQFMALALNKSVKAMQANGGALSQNWTAGQPLTYIIPTANNAFMTGFWVNCALTVTPAAGSSAVYGLTAAGVLAMIDSIVVQYGGVQHNFRPIIMKHLSQLMGQYQPGWPRTVLAGESVSDTDSYYSSNTFGTAVGANTWTFGTYIPMNLLHPQDIRGILPIQNGETSAYVQVNCAGSALGLDPLLNAIYPVSGSGHAVTVSGTVSLIAEYKDGMTYSQLAALQPNLSGIETVQLMRDTPLQNLGASQIYRNKVSFLKKIAYLIVYVIDSVQSDKFALTSNIQIIETSGDSTGNRPFLRYGSNTNLDVHEFYTDLCGKMGGLLKQDIDQGVLPLVYGPIFQQSDASNLEGAHNLDCTIQSGWTDFHYGVQLASVASTTYSGFTTPSPRLEAHMVLINDPLVF